MVSAAFSHSVPLQLRTRSPATPPSSRSTHTCPMHATSGTPGSPPPPDGNGSNANASNDSDPLSKSRVALEKMFDHEMAPVQGRDGKCECIWCNGTKERRCSWCQGRGVRYEIISKSWDELKEDIEKMQSGEKPQFMEEPKKVPVTCSACSGSKKLRCAYCRGSGVGSYGYAY